MTSTEINLRDTPDGPAQTFTLSNLPDDRYPGDLSFLAPIVSYLDRLYLIRSNGFGYGPAQTPEYLLVSPVVIPSRR
jgi:hypothetical protein